MKTEHWIEELKFSVEHFDERGNLQEVLARLHDLDAARAGTTSGRVIEQRRMLSPKPLRPPGIVF
jgi:hypothetical protein